MKALDWDRIEREGFPPEDEQFKAECAARHDGIAEINRRGREVYDLREAHKADGSDDSYDRWDKASDSLGDLIYRYASEQGISVVAVPIDNYTRDALREPTL